MLDVELESSPQAAALARQVLDALESKVPARRLRDLRLLVSELVTNAVRHAGLTAGDPIRLVVRLLPKAVRVEVRDRGSGFDPRPPDPDPERTSGWGLYLVDELADRWGVDGESGGTNVWFEVDR